MFDQGSWNPDAHLDWSDFIAAGDEEAQFSTPANVTVTGLVRLTAVIYPGMPTAIVRRSSDGIGAWLEEPAESTLTIAFSAPVRGFGAWIFADSAGLDVLRVEVFDTAHTLLSTYTAQVSQAPSFIRLLRENAEIAAVGVTGGATGQLWISNPELVTRTGSVEPVDQDFRNRRHPAVSGKEIDDLCT